MKIILSLLAAFLFLLAGCTHPIPQDFKETESTIEILGPHSVPEETEPSSEPAPIELIEGPTNTPYINKVLLETVERITTPDIDRKSVVEGKSV